MDLKESPSLLRRARDGDPKAQSVLWTKAYNDLHRIAQRVLSREKPGHTLQPSVLISDLYLRLRGGAAVEWQDTEHFFRTAARAFRRILVDHARTKQAARRPKAADRVPLDEVFVYAPDRMEDVLVADELLTHLGDYDEELAAVAELRYFCGFTVDEIARAVHVSPTTVKTRLQFAQAWMHARLLGQAPA